MSKRFDKWCVALLCVIAMTTGSVRASAAVDDIAAALRALNDANPEARIAGAEFLAKNLDASQSELKAALNSDEPELATRAHSILNPAPLDLTASQLPPALARYRDAGLSERRRIILEANGRSGAALVAQAWGFERNPDLRQIAWARLLELAAFAGPALLAENNPALADRLLDQAIANDASVAAEAYAAINLARGQVDRAIQQWSERGQRRPVDPDAQHVLAVLYRAKKDWPAARQCAELAENPALLESILLASGDWPAAADRIHRRAPSGDEISYIALLAACDHLAGNDAALNDEIRDLLNKPADPVEVMTAANALALCERPDDAIALLSKHHQSSIAFEMLAARGRIDEAFALVAQRDADTGNDAALLRINAARLAYRLGLTERMSAFFQRVAKETNPAKSPAVFATMALAERDCGRPQMMWDHFAQALASAPDDPSLLALLPAAFRDRNDIAWPALWQLLNESFPANQKKENFARLRAIYDRTIPAMQVRDLSKWNGHGPIQAAVRDQLSIEAAQRFIDAGDRSQAGALIDVEAARTESPQTMMRLGDFAARNNDWPRAARWYGQAWDDDRSQALPLYLRAAALERLGRPPDAHEDDAMARLLSGADDVQRYFVIVGLESHGVEDPIAGEAEILLATASPLGYGSDLACHLAAAAASEAHDTASEAAMIRAMIAQLSAGTYRLNSAAAYISLPYRLHLMLAHTAAEAGDLKSMKQHIQTCRQLIGDEINLAIDLVPTLQQRGHPDIADSIFDETHQLQSQLAAQYPASAMRHNQLAWLDAECRQRLDEALDHARRAVELDPRRTAYIDTLAEVYFQRGQFPAAIEQMNRCIELEPKVPRHRAQLKRFQSAAALAPPAGT